MNQTDNKVKVENLENPIIVKVCRCGKEFISSTKHFQKYCSHECATHFHYLDCREQIKQYMKTYNLANNERLPKNLENARYKALKSSEKPKPILSDNEICRLVDKLYENEKPEKRRHKNLG